MDQKKDKSRNYLDDSDVDFTAFMRDNGSKLAVGVLNIIELVIHILIWFKIVRLSAYSDAVKTLQSLSKVIRFGEGPTKFLLYLLKKCNSLELHSLSDHRRKWNATKYLLPSV